MIENFFKRGMLVSLRVSAWTARKFDRKVTHETNAAHGAVADAGRFNKMLLPGNCESFKALEKHIGSIRTAHYAQTLAWSDEGWRLLPTANYMQYASMVRGMRVDFEHLLDVFLAEYPALKEAAETRLNGMYRPDDYPKESEIRAKFGFYFDRSPLPAKGDFRCEGLSDEDMQEIETSTQARVYEAVNEAMKDAWTRLRNCVKHIHERTADPQAIFRDSLILNARELCDTLGRLNITGDKDLEAFRSEVEGTLALNDPDVIRENDSLRQDTAILAEDILARMQATYSF